MLRAYIDVETTGFSRSAGAVVVEVGCVITEEFWELVEAVRSNDYVAIYEEAQDVAIGALWLMVTIKAREVPRG